MTSASESDLRSLVPARSAARTVTVTLAVLVLLTGAALSPVVLRPSLMGSGWSTAASTTTDGELLVVLTTEPRAWPWATLDGVDDVPGADVVDVWLRHPPTEPDDDLAWWPVGPEGDPYRVPARFDRAQVSYAILWRVTDCQALEPFDEVTGHVTTALGTTARTELASDAAPAEHLDLLVDEGVCEERPGG